MNIFTRGLGAAVFALMTGIVPAMAGDITPDFSTAPTGWFTDRYNPTSFGNVGSYMGRNDVLGIGITSAGDLANRPGPYQSTFYNTQGMGYNLSGGAGSILSGDLFVPGAWSNPANGSVRTDMWAVMTDGSSVTGYPIIGFTNYGGAARFRAWDDDTGWVDLVTGVNFDNWNTLSMTFTGTSVEFSVNGALAYTDNTMNGSTNISEAIVQGYNFADPAITGATPVDYVAHWDNTQVPEPASLLVLASAFGGLLIFRRRGNNHTGGAAT